MNILCIGDATIPGAKLARACSDLKIKDKKIDVADWETDDGVLQDRRCAIEKAGPTAEPVLPGILKADNDVQMLFILFAPVSTQAMEALPNLKLIGTSRAGVENIDVQTATEKGIIVLNVRGPAAHAVSDFTIGLLLAEVRNIARAFHEIKNNNWFRTSATSEFISEVSGKTLGIVGFGYIGRLVAKKMKGFDLKTLVYDPFVGREIIAGYGAVKVFKEELFSQSDFVTVHARVTDENKCIIGSPELKLMKSTSVLINTARAELIDEEALYDILKNKKIAGAALDVFWKGQEPLPKGSLWLKLDNVTLTPHIAGPTAYTLKKSPILLVHDINRLLLGDEPQFVVNPEVFEKTEVKEWLQSIQST